MLARRLEPEVMDSPTEAIDYDSMDHSAVNRQFAADFFAHWSGDNPILDVGTGPARIPIEVCQVDPRPQIIAGDLSAEMIAVAKSNISAAGSDDRISVQKLDAKKLPFPNGTFAAVICNAIVHHIHEPYDILSEIVRVSSLGGLIFVRDLLRPESLDELHLLVDAYATDANEHQRSMFADSLLAALTIDEVRSIVAQLGLPTGGVQITSDRHWTWVAKR